VWWFLLKRGRRACTGQRGMTLRCLNLSPFFSSLLFFYFFLIITAIEYHHCHHVGEAEDEETVGCDDTA
jgi:hypothetical protein